jgi:hypothetical protein
MFLQPRSDLESDTASWNALVAASLETRFGEGSIIVVRRHLLRTQALIPSGRLQPHAQTVSVVLQENHSGFNERKNEALACSAGAVHETLRRFDGCNRRFRQLGLLRKILLGPGEKGPGSFAYGSSRINCRCAC